MTHITSIGAGIFSDLSYSIDNPDLAAPSTAIEATYKGYFVTLLANGTNVTAGVNEFRRIADVREFPQMGTPPNIVNVPTFGFKTSKQVQGQADAPTFEVTINYVPSDWDTIVTNYKHGSLVGNGKLYPFRFTLLNSAPTGTWASVDSTGLGAGGIGNSQYFWMGKFEALQINPQLTDGNTAVLTISIQSDFVGPFTNT